MSRALLFNPIRAREGELEATLVARKPLLDELEAAILGDEGATTRHWLIIAPRGSGKSHLTEALARRVRARPRWSVVRLPEEAYRVSSVADLLAWVVGALEKIERPFAAETDPTRIETLAESRLRKWRLEQGPVLVILENLHQLVGHRFDRRSQARLRALLMGDPPFTLVATSTRMFAEVSEHTAPFYDFFQERRLEELTADEVAELIERRATWEGATDLVNNPDLQVRVRALYHLSGGNPRLALALFAVLRAGLTSEIYDQLLQLLDEVTPYYQSRLNDASPQGARILAEMAMGEGPLVPSELGRRAGFKTTQVTALLAQLQEERFVRPGGRPVDKRARYWEVTDRLFRLWLQMREQGDPQGTMRWIVEFYRGWYGQDAIRASEDARRMVRGAWEGTMTWEDLRRTLRHVEEALGNSGLVSSLAWFSDLGAVGLQQEPALRERWVAGDRSVGVPLALCAMKRGSPPESLMVLEAVPPESDPAAGLLLALGYAGNNEVDHAWAVAERPSPHRVNTLWFLTVSLLASPLPERALRARAYPEVYQHVVGVPDWTFARYVAGESLDEAEIDAVRAWLEPRFAHEPTQSVLFRAVSAQFAALANDPALARAESAIPADAVLHHLVFRAVRFMAATERKRPFFADQPFPLSKDRALEAWTEIPSDLAALREYMDATSLLALYAALRALDLLPELPPYADAERVLAAEDREAALSGLHPEVREAVLLLITPRG